MVSPTIGQRAVLAKKHRKYRLAFWIIWQHVSVGFIPIHSTELNWKY